MGNFNSTLIALTCILLTVVWSENYYDGSKIKISDIKYYLSNSSDTLAKKRLFGGRFASSENDIVIVLCSNVATQLFIEAEKRKSQIQILSKSQTRALEYGTTYNVIIQTHECDASYSKALQYKHYKSFIQADDYEITGIITKNGKLNHDWYVYMDLTAPRITKNYHRLMDGAKSTSLIKGHLLSIPKIKGIIMTTCNSLMSFHETTFTISNSLNNEVPKISMVQMDWVDCQNGEALKTQCFKALYTQNYTDKYKNQVTQIYIDFDESKTKYSHCPITHHEEEIQRE